MCQPSAVSAIEPVTSPHDLPTTIVTAVIAYDDPRPPLPFPVPRSKRWLCRQPLRS
jgi:hypothetical protein